MPAFYNHATLSYNNTVINSNTVHGDLVAALSAEKTAVHNRYRHGDMITYALTLVNSGATDSGDLRITDDLGAYEFGQNSLVPLEYVEDSVKLYVNGELQDTPEVTLGAPLQFDGIRVPAGGNAILLYTVRINRFAPLGEDAVITNTARLDRGLDRRAARDAAGDRENSPSFPIFVSEDIYPETSPQLSIRKSLSPTVVAPGEPLTYTLTIENSGTSAVGAEGGAVVSDSFDPLINITSVRYNGMEWNSPANYSYNEETGLFTTAVRQISIPAAVYSQDANSGEWRVTPGVSTIQITGTLG